MYKPIRDYAIIGNLRSAALVSKDGSIDWMCAPFIDSPSIFAALLDDKKGGYWIIRPRGKFESSQEYLPDTNILVTKFITKIGTTEVTDCLPMKEEAEAEAINAKKAILEVHRKVFCVQGICSLKTEFEPRVNYARDRTKLSLIKDGIKIGAGKRRGVLESRANFGLRGGRATANFTLKKSESQYFTLHIGSTETPSFEGKDSEKEIQKTKEFWENWVHRCELKVCPSAGPWHDAAVRSSLLLKILFFEPPGTIAAAATTSLPETVGGVRNWDYRFTWIRDSAFTLQALFWMGYIEEAEKYLSWIIRECCRGLEKNPEELQPVYGLDGRKEIDEEILPHLKGYRGSKPVRIGNNAYRQKQWDVYGSILNTIWRYHKLHKKIHKLDSRLWQQLRSFANYVVIIWREPDEGFWEVRGGRRHFVYSKVMCWTALNCATKLAKSHNLPGEIDLWQREMKLIREEIMRRGWNEKKQSFVQSFDSEALDATLLLMPTVGFIYGKDPRMLSTIKRIEKELSMDGGLLRRYNSEDGLPGKEGAFLLASFWLVDAYVFSGEKQRAEALFSKLIKLANHAGLFSEEIDPKTKEFLGNFPQALTHIGLINSAFYLSLGPKGLRT